MTFTVDRGSDDSASIDLLGFEVASTGIKDSILSFKIVFDDPNSVSIGEVQDSVTATIVDESFFASKDSGLSITSGTQIVNLLPKMLANDELCLPTMN